MRNPLSEEHLRHARVLWDYHRLGDELEPADFVLAMGSHDERVAEHAAKLVLEGLAPLLVASGGYGKITRGLWGLPEGERFAKIAESMGVPRCRLIVENAATNTGDNIVKTCAVLAERGIGVTSGILVNKPYMCRRAYATAVKQWPEIRWYVSAPELEFEQYPNEEVPIGRMISLMVGDLQRIAVYGEQGFQIPQEIPPEVWRSYEALRDAGYDEFVIPNV